jgi:HAD superfamily hydrolase (TIGR01509 family)
VSGDGAGGLQAVLMDMDGTLVDTEPDWIACERALVAAHGGVWTDALGAAQVGKPLLVAAENIRLLGGVDLPPEEIVEILLDGVVAGVRHEVRWQPGARALLEEIAAAGIPCALVTMSYRRLARAVVSGLPPKTFATVVTGDEVEHGKPHPEAYLEAANRLGVDPRRCVAIEDSPTGLASAEAAGCAVVGVPHIVAIPAAPGRTVVGSLADLAVQDLREIVHRHATSSGGHDAATALLGGDRIQDVQSRGPAGR